MRIPFGKHRARGSGVGWDVRRGGVGGVRCGQAALDRSGLGVGLGEWCEGRQVTLQGLLRNKRLSENSAVLIQGRSLVCYLIHIINLLGYKFYPHTLINI